MRRPLLDAEEVAELLGITRRAITDHLYRSPESLPPSFKIGALRRWDPDDVDEWLKARRDEANRERQERIDAIEPVDVTRGTRTQLASSHVLVRVSPSKKENV